MKRNCFVMIALVLSVLLISGCTTTYKDFKSSNVRSGEGVAIGKVNVKYNGKNMNRQCAICLNSANGPCQGLTDEGFVIQNVPVGDASIRRVVCKDTSLQHYNIDQASFLQKDGVTYFGQVDIDWANAGGFKTTDLFGLIGALISESKNDGSIKMTVSTGDPSATLKAYQKVTHETDVKMAKVIATPGR